MWVMNEFLSSPIGISEATGPEANQHRKRQVDVDAWEEILPSGEWLKLNSATVSVFVQQVEKHNSK